MRHLYIGLLLWSIWWPHVVRADDGPTQTTAFIHVNVVPMDRERVLRDQTVIVEGGKIVALIPLEIGVMQETARLAA